MSLGLELFSSVYTAFAWFPFILRQLGQGSYFHVSEWCQANLPDVDSVSLPAETRIAHLLCNAVVRRIVDNLVVRLFG